MAGAGKTSVGKKLALDLNKNFIDSDKIIEDESGKTLQGLMVELGTEEFKKVERKTIQSIKLDNTVLATGGSVVLSEEAMHYLRDNSKVIYLEVSFEDVSRRVSGFNKRGFIKDSDQTVEEAFLFRKGLYQQYSHYVVSNDGSITACLDKIKSLF